MPLFDYRCGVCSWVGERCPSIAERNAQKCDCGAALERLLSAPLFKFAGRVTPGGGPDRFTADMLGIPLKELPSGLKAEG